jgi:eukaryotic-like serine/threonine-protein kinase
MGSLQISGPAEDGGVAPTERTAQERELKTAFDGRYEILSELGRGAMGVVYKAEDRVIGRTVALKTIAVGREAPDHDDVIERLKSEAKAAGSLDHPNIITIYDVGNDGDRVYLSMQFVEGSTLAAMLEGKNLRPGQLTLLSYAEQICNGVAFAHERGVVHRDLKPSNLMLTPQGQIKVLDFGIAKKGDASMTQSGMVVGTPSYMAPEQATGKPVDQRSDIFSLGAVLYELFTGQKAFHADSVTAVLYKVVHEEPDLPATINPAIPAGVEAAIRKALAKDPGQRFQSCVELRDALRREAVLLRTASAKILAKPLLESTRHARLAGKGKSRRALPILLASCIVLASTAIVVWPQRAKMPRLVRFIGYVRHFGKHASASGTAALPSTTNTTNVTATVATKDIATNVPATVSPVAAVPAGTARPESQPPDSTAVSSTSPQPVTNQPTTAAPTQAVSLPSPGGPTDSKNTQAVTDTARHAVAASPTASGSNASNRDVKNEPEPVAVTPTTTNDQPADRQQGAGSSEPSDEPVAPKRARPVVPPAPTVVEGFTRKDISDLLNKADAASGSGDYKSAVYEYDIVLRLDRVNARAREGLRRAREAEKERR